MFGKTWQLVARAEELPRVGDFVPVTVAGRAGRHHPRPRRRAARPSTTCAAIGPARWPSTAGNRKSLQCRYHGWTYGLDGCLRACPEMEETEGFAKEDFGLVPVRVDRWGPFVFVNLDDDGSAAGRLPGRDPRRGGRVRLRRRAHAPGGAARLRRSSATGRSTSTTTSRATTCPIAHPQLFKELDYDAYRVEEFRYYSKQHAPIRELKPGEELGVDRRYMRQPGARGFRALLLALPQHDVQHLPGQHVLQRDPAARAGPHADDLRVVLRRAGHRRRLGVDAAGDRVLRRDPAGGHRHLRAGPARPPIPRLRRAAASPPSARTASTTSRTSSASSSGSR